MKIHLIINASYGRPAPSPSSSVTFHNVIVFQFYSQYTFG